jgi:hypothetical protein
MTSQSNVASCLENRHYSHRPRLDDHDLIPDMKYSKPRHAGSISRMVRGMAAKSHATRHSGTDTLKSGLLTRGAFRSWTITCIRGALLLCEVDVGPRPRCTLVARFSSARSVRSRCSCSPQTDGSYDHSAVLDPSCGSAQARDSIYRRAVPGRSQGFARSAEVLEVALVSDDGCIAYQAEQDESASKS